MTNYRSIKNHEIAILILSTQDENYNNFKKAIINSWFKRMKKNDIKCYFYSGSHDINSIEDDQIKLICSDKLKDTSDKLIRSLELVMKMHPEIKLIFRTNLSSYIEYDNFIKYIEENKLNETTYAGLIGETNYIREYFYGNRYLHKLFTIFPLGRTIRFASGAGFFMGRENINKLINSKKKYLNLIDDVMVAKTLNIEPDKITIPLRFDIMENNIHKVSKYKYEDLISKGMLYHYRFKTKDRKIDANLLGKFDDPIFRYDFCTLNNDEI